MFLVDELFDATKRNYWKRSESEISIFDQLPEYFTQYRRWVVMLYLTSECLGASIISSAAWWNPSVLDQIMTYETPDGISDYQILNDRTATLKPHLDLIMFVSQQHPPVIDIVIYFVLQGMRSPFIFVICLRFMLCHENKRKLCECCIWE